MVFKSQETGGRDSLHVSTAQPVFQPLEAEIPWLPLMHRRDSRRHVSLEAFVRNFEKRPRSSSITTIMECTGCFPRPRGSPTERACVRMRLGRHRESNLITHRGGNRWAYEEAVGKALLLCVGEALMGKIGSESRASGRWNSGIGGLGVTR